MAIVVTSADSKSAVGAETHPIAPQILAAIAAAAIAVLGGAQIRIASVYLEQGQDGSASRWTRQGRSSVQASHNLRTNRQPR
jgi:hypothetical protein